MFCEKCGAKNSGSSKFCEKCGSKLEAEVKETKKKTTKKETTKTTPDLKEKFNTLSKKQKIIGGIVLVLVVVLIVLYVVGSKLTSLETMGSKMFEELADKSTINNKYLSVPLNSDEYFVSLADTMKEKIKDADLAFDYKDYTVTTSKRKITVKYHDNEDDETYKVIFNFKEDGKQFLIYDKYVITKVTIENKNRGQLVIYDPSDTEKLTLTVRKGSKITIDEKEISTKYINSKKSDDENDVYVIKGIARGNYDVQFSLGSLTFEKTVYVYLDEDNEYDLNEYISYSYLTGETKEYAKVFKTYITTYYEYVMDESKTVEDFGKKYKLTDDIKDEFADSKEYTGSLESFKIKDVTVRSLYYYPSDEEFVVTYKVDYTYKYESSSSERSTYDTVRVTYDLSNIELPIDLDYMPY